MSPKKAPDDRIVVASTVSELLFDIFVRNAIPEGIVASLGGAEFQLLQVQNGASATLTFGGTLPEPFSGTVTFVRQGLEVEAAIALPAGPSTFEWLLSPE